MSKLKRKELEDYQKQLKYAKTGVDMIQTKYDGECLGFKYVVDSDSVQLYYHEPSLCFCKQVNDDEPRETSLRY